MTDLSSRFFHSEDNLITIGDGAQELTIPLTEFLMYEPAYTLPAHSPPYIKRSYIPLVRHWLFTSKGQFDGGLPYAAGDTYIANLSDYIDQHNNPVKTLEEAKADKKVAVENLNFSYKNGNVSLFSTIMPSQSLDPNQIISYTNTDTVPVGFYLKDIDGVHVSLDLAQLNTYNDGVVQLHYVSDLNADSLKEDIDDLTTVEEVDGFDITTGWPTIPYTPT